MFRTFLASTAIATTLGLAAVAQGTPDPMLKPGTETQNPSAMEPLAPATQAESAEPTSPMTTAPSMETAQEPATPGTMTAPAGSDRVLSPVLAADISVDSLKGATIETADGQGIAEIDDVLIGPDGNVENVVAQFGGFLGFGSNKVLLKLDEIEILQDQSGAYVVQTALTPESLEGRPEYEAE